MPLVDSSALHDDPVYPLETGPLRPVDPDTVGVSLPTPNFTGLVGDAFQPLGGLHNGLDTAQQTIVEHSTTTRVDAASAQLLDPAGETHAAVVATFAEVDPTDVIGATNAHASSADSHAGQYDDPPPDEHPVPDPGPKQDDPERPTRGV